MIEIDKAVPMPRAYRAKYPWRSMKVGDSFFVPNISQNNLASQANIFRKKNEPSWKFTTRKEGNGVRVWRTA